MAERTEIELEIAELMSVIPFCKTKAEAFAIQAEIEELESML